MKLKCRFQNALLDLNRFCIVLTFFDIRPPSKKQNPYLAKGLNIRYTAMPHPVGMIVFDLQVCGGCWRPKTSYLGSNFGTLTQGWVHPSAPVLQPKIHQETLSVMTLGLNSQRMAAASKEKDC